MLSRLGVAGLGGVALAALAWWSWASCNCDKLALDAEAARLIAGLSFVVAGMVALAQGRFRRVGVLLSAVGWTWFIYEIGYIYQPLPYTFARVSAGVWQPILAHLAVGFPSGRLRSRVDRLVVLAAYVLYWVTSFVLVAFWHSRGPALTARNLLFINDDPHLLDGVQLISQLLVILVAVLVLGVVVWHWRTASVPARRALEPLLWASGPLGVVVIAYALLGARYFPSLLPLAMTALPAAFLVGLLRIRLDRSAVGPLVVELGQHPAPDQLERALVRTLHDPTLRVAYWARDRRTFVDVMGLPVDLPADGSGRVATRIERNGALIAVLVHDSALRDDPELVDASIAAARLALENERLHAEVSAQLQEVRASRARIVAVGDAERQRVERNLHDGAQQRLVTLSLALKVAQARLGADADPAVATTLQAASQELNRALAELRELARGIHPAILSEAGLGPALESLAECAPVPVTITATIDDRLAAPVEVAAYFVVSEALTNVTKYARASRVTLEVMRVGDLLRVQVADDGVGGAEMSRGSGLQGLVDRLRALNGQLEVVSPPGAGTTLLAVIPCGDHPAPEMTSAAAVGAGQTAREL
jgi:signal transduction histidine kinase